MTSYEDPSDAPVTAPILDVDLHVALPCRPSDALDEALTSAGLRCYSDKRLSADKPRVYQGRGQTSQIQELIGEAGAVFVKYSRSMTSTDKRRPSDLSISPSSEPHDPPVPPVEAQDAAVAVAPSSSGHAEVRDEPDAPAADTTTSPGMDPWLACDERYSAPSNVGADARGDA